MMLSCTLWSCSKSDGPIDDPDNPDNPDAPTNVMLDISVSDLVFGAEVFASDKDCRIARRKVSNSTASSDSFFER